MILSSMNLYCIVEGLECGIREWLAISRTKPLIFFRFRSGKERCIFEWFCMTRSILIALCLVFMGA